MEYFILSSEDFDSHYFISGKHFYCRHVFSDSTFTKARRISEENFISAYEEYMNY